MVTELLWYVSALFFVAKNILKHNRSQPLSIYQNLHCFQYAISFRTPLSFRTSIRYYVWKGKEKEGEEDGWHVNDEASCPAHADFHPVSKVLRSLRSMFNVRFLVMLTFLLFFVFPVRSSTVECDVALQISFSECFILLVCCGTRFRTILVHIDLSANRSPFYIVLLLISHHVLYCR